MAKQEKDPRVTKRKVTMRTAVLAADGVHIHEVTDYVDAGRPGLLDAYLTDARRRWQYVTVSDEPDAGPAGYDGATAVPFGTHHTVRAPDGSVERVEFHEFPHPLAGTFYPAADCVDCDHAPTHPVTGARARTVHAGAQEG